MSPKNHFEGSKGGGGVKKIQDIIAHQNADLSIGMHGDTQKSSQSSIKKKQED
jgi:hypothetical protein